MTKILVGTAVMVIGGIAVLSAQSQGGNAISRELVSEVRALRTAFERYADTQVQTQTLASLLEVQQRRVGELNMRLDAVRKELDAASLRMQDVSRRLTDAEQATPEGLRHVPPAATPADRRAALDEIRATTRQEFDAGSAQLQQIRARESELLNQLATEEGRWHELVGRLDQWVRR